MPPPAVARRRRARWFVAGGVAVACVAYPFVVGQVAARVVAAKATARLGRTVTVGSGIAGFGRITLRGVQVAGRGDGLPLISVREVKVPFGAALGWHSASPVTVTGLAVRAIRGGDYDNVSDILERLSAHRAAAKTDDDAKPVANGDVKPVGADDGGGKPALLPGVALESGSLSVRDGGSGLAVEIQDISGVMLPSDHLMFRLKGVTGRLAVGGSDHGPQFGAREVQVQAGLRGLRPDGYPSLLLQDGSLTALSALSLTGISGRVGPPPAGVTGGKPGEKLIIDLHGSYGGAKETLWTARGGADPVARQGRLVLRAEQFSLDRVADILPRSVLRPADTNLDAGFDLTWAGDAIGFGGEMAVVGLSLQNDALASAPIENVSVSVVLRATAYPALRRLDIQQLQGRVRDLIGKVSGSVSLPTGTVKFADGNHWPFVPKIDLLFEVPRLKCAKLLSSIPEALTPHLQGFDLKGMFEAKVGAHVDFADLEATALTGKVDIDGCEVLAAPDAVAKLSEPRPIIQNVEVPKPLGAEAGETEIMQFLIGPENPDFVPYAQISRHLINSIMTTEDNGFFRHRGWVSSEFKSALKRNLARGGFRMGASSITMQMVKNVLLSQEKTLSRKMQELFLVWYIEQQLSKERILELYFNAIEFGPRIYGIGPAARHYFGKKASDLTPMEAAFFSSILPSPKRRYIQFCHGTVYPPWDKYLRRIVAKVHERGRLDDAEFADVMSQPPLVFDRSEATFTEKQCLEWVKKMTARPEPEPPPDLDADNDSPGETVDLRGAGGKRGKHAGQRRTTANQIARSAKRDARAR
ncbi:MAG TPA: biosynthetic peptidoglycan transglycosylase [Polyangia bacterium]|nr:biosynthetic peptidoglycan transglycosylase [Polyangia bacterium]